MIEKSSLPEALTEEYREIWDNMLMPVDTNINFKKVILSEENKQKYEQFIKEFKYTDKLGKYGWQPSNTILLYGVSGTGKTFSAKALANKLGYTMLYVDIAKSLTDGNVARNISDIFKLANHIERCIIFFDEADSIAINREISSSDSGIISRATNSIFQNIDQMKASNIFIAATNMLHRIDRAFERRMSIKMQFNHPELDLDKCISHFLYNRFMLEDNIEENKRQIIKRRAANHSKLS